MSTIGGRRGVGRNGPANATEQLFSAHGIGKSYAGIQVLRAVDVSLYPGNVLALFGENGAGKSTLMKIVSGGVRPDTGKMTIHGQPYAPRSPLDALRKSVAVITQELSLCPDLSAAENMVLGAWPGGQFVKRKATLERAAELMAETGVSVPLTRPLRDLSLGERQLVEILKAVNRQSQVLLLDEPTAALPRQEADRVLALVSSLAARGVALIIVTHRINEALDIANSCLVLRSGSVALHRDAAEVKPGDVVDAMLGRSLQKRSLNSPSAPGSTQVMRVQGWVKSGTPGIRGVSLNVGSGEVVGVYGAVDSGTDTLASVLAGTTPLDGGRTTIRGQEIRKFFRSPRARVAAGVHFVPGDRRGKGLAMSQSILTNLMFPPGATKPMIGFVNRKAEERAAAAALIEEYAVVCTDMMQPVNRLSGGNQQKILLASRVGQADRSSGIFVLHEPTRGVDIGAREAIHHSIRRIASEGGGVLVLSTDVDEIVELADRVLVLGLGRVVAEFKGADITTPNMIRASDLRSGNEGGAQEW